MKVVPRNHQSLRYIFIASFLTLLLLLTLRPAPAAAVYYEPTGPNYVISAGWQHTCALTSGGDIDCWGRNSEGQAEDHSGPFTQVSTGSTHTCALTTSGAVDCWGLGEFGEADDKPGPYTQLATTDNHTCAITPGGAIECWGNNFYGQSTGRSGPYIQVSAAGSTSCGLTPSGIINCWGYKTANRNGPYTQVTGGDSACGLTVGGAVECWSGGANLSQYAEDGPYTQISFHDHVCGLTPEGAADCWGNLDTESADYPGPYSQITTGDGYTCALKTYGAADCWGEDNYPASDREGPFLQVDAGTGYTCARTPSGAANCWPYDPYYYVWEDLPGPFEDISVADNGACGLKTNAGAHFYQCWSISGIGPVTSGPYIQISKGRDHICGLMVAGEVECWGRASEGQGGYREGPYSQVSAGYFHNCAIYAEGGFEAAGDIDCWGFNSSGQAFGLEGPFVQVSAGNSHSCALNVDGGVECWGDNTYGQSAYHAGPYTQVSAGYRFTCALRENNGAIDCWGHFSHPVYSGGTPATGHPGPFIQVAAGHMYACGLTINLDVECWPEPTPGQAKDQPGPFGPYVSPAILNTAIDGAPSNPSLNADASFSFSSPVSGATFDCRLDSSYWMPCASPQTYPSLPDGSHAFQVRAKSASGHIDTTPAEYSWIIDAVLPETEITSKPANPTNSITGAFTFSSPDPTATFECQLDGSGWEECTTPKTYYPLSDGEHTFSVRAKDATETVDPTPATYTWTIDRVGPDTTITSGPPSSSSSSTATFTFTSPEATATFECWLDYVGTWSTCSSPEEYTGLSDGAHTFLVRARDLAGNVDTIPPSYNWTITTTPTNQPPNPPSNPSPTNGATNVNVGSTISWSASDPDNDPLTYEVRFGTVNPPPQVIANQSASTYDPPGNLTDGTTYYWQIVAKDTAHPGGTDGPVWSFTTAAPTAFPDVFYVSPATNGTVSGIAYTGSDILQYTKSTNAWAMVFDGSDVGVTKNVSAFAFLPGGDILLSFAANQPISGLGTFAAHDVARFHPTSTGINTAGTFAWYFDGSDVGLTTSGEKIDALDALADGRLLISVSGAGAVPKPGGGTIKWQDEDVAAFTPTGLGATTTGTWGASPFFDGTAVTGLGAEDVSGFWFDEPTGDRYLTIVGAFNLGGLAGNGKSIVKLPAGSATPALVPWTTPPFNVDGLEVGQ